MHSSHHVREPARIPLGTQTFRVSCCAQLTSESSLLDSTWYQPIKDRPFARWLGFTHNVGQRIPKRFVAGLVRIFNSM